MDASELKQELDDLEFCQGQLQEDALRRRKDLVAHVAEALGKYEASGTETKIRDLLWIRNLDRKKFELKWIGPSVFVDRTQFSVKIKGDSGRERVVNLGDVKPYKGLVRADPGTDAPSVGGADVGIGTPDVESGAGAT